MNRIYKVIWNKSKQCYTVVSELAKSHSKSPSGCTLSRRKVASILSAVMLAGGVMFGTPGIVSASNADGVIVGTGAPGQYIAFADGQGHGFAEAHKNQTITIIDPSTQKEIKYISTKVSTSDGKVSQWYWVREGYNAQLVENKRYPNANKSYVIEGYKQDNFTGGTQDDVIKNYQSGSQQTNIYTNNGNKISDVKAGVYGGGSNGYTPVESISTNGGKYFFLDKDGKGNWEAAQNGDFVALSKNATTGLYEYDGKAVDPSKLYSIKVNGKYETGIFINSDKSIYTGAVYGYNNEILLTTYDKTQGKYISYWGAEIVDPKATIGQMTVGTFNGLLDELNTNIKNVQKENIKQIYIKPEGDGGTIGLITMGDVDANGYPKGGEAVPGSITITSKDGYDGNDAELIFTNRTPKTYTTDPKTGKISVKDWNENSFTVKAGSTVKALGSKNSVGIKVNGIDYTVETRGDNVHLEADEKDPNKYILSVDKTNDAAVIYDENNGSIRSTNATSLAGGSVILGKEAKAKKDAVAIGDNSSSGNSSTAIGIHASAEDGQNVALGHWSSASGSNNVALGANSKVSTADVIDTDKHGVISVGVSPTKDNEGFTRRVINVSAGVNDTDAVNVSQLKDVADEAAKHTTLTDGKNTTVEDIGTDGQHNYKVNLNDNITLGEGEHQIQINGAPEDDAPAISMGGDKFVVAQDGSISSKVSSGIFGGFTSFEANGEGATFIKGDSWGSSNTKIEGGKITVTGQYSGDTVIDGGIVSTDILKVYPDTNNKLEFNKNGLNINSFDTNANVGKDGVSLSVDNGEGKNNSVKVTADETIFSYTEGGATAATTTVIKGQQITAGKVLVNSEAGKSTVIGLTNTNITDEGFATAGRAATEEQLKAMSSAENGGGFGLTDDNGKAVTKSLGETIKVKGDKNITTIANNADGSLTVALKENLTGIKTISNGNKTLSITDTGIGFNVINPEDFSSKSIVVTADGTTISGGLSVDGSKITNVADGEISKTSKDAVNGSQLNALDEKWAEKDKGNVKYDVNPDGSINYDKVIFAGTTYTGLGTDGKYHGGTHVYNVAYASGERGDEAVNVDYLNDKVTEIENNTASAEKHIDTSKEYTVDSNGQVKLDEVNGNDKPTGNQVVIKDVASKAQQDKNTAIIGDKDNNGLKDDYEGTNYISEAGTLVDADKKLDAAIKDLSGKVEQTQANHTEVKAGNGITVTDKGTADKHNYEVGLADDFTLGGKDGQTGSINIEGSKGNITATGNITAGGTVTGSDFKAGDITVNKDNSGEVSGLHNTSWDNKLAENVANDKKNNEGKGAASTAATQGQLGDVDTKVNNNTTMINNNTANIQNNSNRITNLENRVGDVEERIDKVGAMAAAMANLHTMGYDPAAPTEISASIGQYKSETALAVGFFHYPNQDFMLSGSISVAGDEVMAGVGATWKIGRKTQAQLDAKEAERRIIKAAEIKQAAKDAEVKAQAERHAKLLAEREAQAHG